MISQQYLKSILRYDPETGKWFWLVNRGSIIAGLQAGGISAEGYLVIGIDGKVYKAHRLAWIYMTGECPVEVDHENRNRSDCRWENIRKASRQQNTQNATVKSNSKSGIKGVRKKYNQWESRIKFNGNAIHLGYFKTAEEAHEAYKKAADFYFGSFATSGN